MKQCPFMPFIGGHGKPDIGFGMIGCSILALIFLQLEAGHLLHPRFVMLVSMKFASTFKQKQDEAKRQNQHHFVTGLELAKD